MKKFYFELHNLVEEKKTSRRILIMVLHKVLHMVLHNLIRREILVLDLSYIILVDKKNYALRYNQCIKKSVRMNV